MKITRFEDIEAWKVSRRLARQIHDVTASSAFRKQSELRGQLRRAATSAMANIAEGFNAGSDVEFVRFLRISRKSATEVQSHLYSSLDSRAIDQDQFEKLYRTTEDLKKLVGGFIRYLSSSNRRRDPRVPDRGLRTED
jgi:four helix bundle protein